MDKEKENELRVRALESELHRKEAPSLVPSEPYKKRAGVVKKAAIAVVAVILAGIVIIWKNGPDEDVCRTPCNDGTC